MSNNETWLDACVADPNNGDPRCRAITIGRTTSAVLSMVGCLFALFVIIVFKKFRFFTQRFVINVLITSFLLATVFVSTGQIQGQDFGCWVAGFMGNLFALSQNLWIMCIEIHLLIMTITQTRYPHLERVYHGVVWSTGLLLSLVPFIGDHYGPTGIWCWIKSETHYENALRVICYYFWLLLLVFGGGGIYIYIIYRVYRSVYAYEGTYTPAVEAKKRNYKKNIRPLILYPFVGLLLGSIMAADRIQNWADPSNPIFGLSFAHSITTPIWGFVNALLYLLNGDTLQQLKPSIFLPAIKSWGLRAITRSSEQSKEKVLSEHHEIPHRGHIETTHIVFSDNCSSNIPDME